IKTHPHSPCPSSGHRKLILIFQSIVFCMICCFPAFAQEPINGSGKVSFQNAGLPGVSILVKGTTLGTSTDPEGNFTIEGIDPNATLIFSLLGFGQQEIPVDGKSTINVVMKEDEIGRASCRERVGQYV